ncbi:MAG: matrixin family metalloprotease [Candidatus Moraniibacteriota bacterium]
MKKILQYGFFVALVLGTVLVWRSVPLPCATPIEYALGNFDSRFGISQEDFLKEATAAESAWERVLGRELFRYVPGAAFKVNLIFDERQEQTIEGQKLESSLEKTQSTQETLEQKQKKTLTLYEKTSVEYERMLSSFKKRLDAYNAEVAKWNREGGAPADEYENLEKVRKALEKEGKALETKRQEVNGLATQVNAFSKQQIVVVEKYNDQVEGYVRRYGEPGEFDQGDYVGSEINIYQYDDLPHLQAVLAHEFGHALGLIHGTNPQSIMYHLMKEQSLSPLTLTEEDKSMLETQCSQTVWDIIWERVGILKGRVLTEKGV